MVQKYAMTPLSKKRLEEELDYLKKVKQEEINVEIKRLRDFWDFSEDVSFKDMLEQQSLVKDRIRMIEEMLCNAELITPSEEQTSISVLGSTVTFIEMPDGEEETYTIVGRIDADPIEHKISTDSPIGKRLLGRKVNDEIFIDIPSGKIKIKIIDIS